MNRPARASRLHRALGMAVHLYTAAGIVCSLWAVKAIHNADFRLAFLVLLVSVLIDASDGTLARVVQVRRATPHIDGRKLDDIVDYVNYTFLPILLIWRGGWLPDPAWLWCAIPLVASLFTFSHVGAKEEENGFFRGFPSYWNVVAFYVAVYAGQRTGWTVVSAIVGLSILSVMPVRFVYPNRPPRWRAFFLGGAGVWLVLLLAMIWQFPSVHPALKHASLFYPVLYTVASFYLDAVRRREAHG